MAFVKKALRFLSPRRKVRAVLVAVVGIAVLASVLTSVFCLFGCYSRTMCESTPLEDSLLTDTLPKTERNAGALNLHMWTVTGSVKNLKQSTLFPCFPDRKTFVADAALAIRRCDTGQRMFGFLHPQSSGMFYFAITSDEGSELWLSPDQHLVNARLIAEVQVRNGGVAYTSPEDFMKYPMQMSGGITLNRDQKYFVEVLHKSGKEYAGHVSILWKPPGAETFSVITKQFLLPFCVSNTEQCPCVGDDQTPSPSKTQPPSPQPVSKVPYSRTKCEWTPLKESLLTDTLPETKRDAGALNLHMWTVCGGRVQSLKQWPLFPCFPDRKAFVADATLAIRGCDTGQRMFGFLHPQSSGTFYFAMTSDEASELWLSPDQHPRNARLIAEVQDRNNGGVAYTSPEDFMKYPMQISGSVALNSDQKYFVEVLHKSGNDYAGHVSILWKPPGAKNFSVITKQFLLPFCVNNAERCPCIGDVQTPLPSHVQPPPPQPVSKEALQHYYNTSYFDQNHLQDVLTFRLYEPSYVIWNGIVNKHQGIKLVGFHLSSVYPGDTVFLNPAPNPADQGAFYAPNKLLPKEHVDALVNQFMEAIRSKHKQ